MGTPTYKLASTIAIEVFGKNSPKTSDVQKDKDGKIITVAAKWQSNRKNRFNIKKGENIVPEWVLEVPMVKHCLTSTPAKMTKGALVSAPVAKKAPKKKAPKKPAVDVVDKEAEAAALAQGADETEDGLPVIEK